ncbi:MAG: FGGY-family carbohydrate kinase, partial [Butyricicoccus sp.]
QATRTLLGKTGIAPAYIEGIAMAQTATTIIFVDAQGEALTDCVMWMDGRAGQQAQRINLEIGEQRFSGKNVLPKLLWFVENEPETVQKAAYMLDVSAYLFHKLTSEWAYEFTGARATNLVDIPKRAWDPAMFELIGFPRRLVPDRIAGSTEKIGVLTAAAAEMLGLAEGIPVFGGCSDHATAELGTGCIRPGDAHIYIGTSAWLAVSTASTSSHAGRMPSPVPGINYHFYDTDSGGACFDYLIQTYYAKELAEGKDAFAVMNQEVRQLQEQNDSENVIFLPFLAGASAPINNTTVRATLLNLKRSTKRSHIARAVLEGVCFNLRWMRDIHTEKNGWKVNFLRGIGGGMSSPVFAQMLADVLETPLTPLENPRFAGNLGLASCIELGLNGEADFTLLDRIVRLGRTYQPNVSAAARYTRLYHLYRQSYQALEAIYEQMNSGNPE